MKLFFLGSVVSWLFIFKGGGKIPTHNMKDVTCNNRVAPQHDTQRQHGNAVTTGASKQPIGTLFSACLPSEIREKNTRHSFYLEHVDLGV
jgi:hypothetical protein